MINKPSKVMGYIRPNPVGYYLQKPKACSLWYDHTIRLRPVWGSAGFDYNLYIANLFKQS